MPINTGSCESKLLGEHVGGSAVRSVYFTSKIYTIGTGQNCSADGRHICHVSADSRDNQLLISVGAKQVLTSWILRYTAPDTKEFSSVSFQWLSTHMPPKFSSTHRKVEKILEDTKKGNTAAVNSSPMPESCLSECMQLKPLSCLLDQSENDWRYLAVTAFLVKHVDSRITVCFIAVSCSDATVTLRALLLPYRLWFDVALLLPQASPVLALQHLVVPGFAHPQDSGQVGNVYIIISGSTDGSITFWDLTETVDYFMKVVLELQPQMLIDCQKRPKTGRGSQGGRWWRMSRNQSSDDGVREEPGAYSVQGSGPLNNPINSSQNMSSTNSHVTGQQPDTLPYVKREVRPLYVLNSIHQSGVNCLHVSTMKNCSHSESETVRCVVSGGDDQAVHCLGFDLVVQLANPEDEKCHPIGKCSRHNCSHQLRILFQDTIYSAHNSAVKGIWTDGLWAFSTGLDQRVRCWRVGSSGKLTEHAHLIISVPEPEALDAVFLVNRYRIAVAGRGMQMIEFCAS